MNRLRWPKRLLALPLLLWLLGSVLGGLSGPVYAQGSPPPPKVTVATPIAKKVARWDEYTGRFEAVEQVEIRPRVSGYIEKIHFSDGQRVKKGDELFTIDQRPYQNAVDVAKSDLDRARAQVTLATMEYERGEQLIATRTIPARDLDQRRANMQSATAQTQSAEAALRSAELNLEWTVVRAPITGRVSDRRVTAGNLVTGGQGETTLLTTIVSRDPIHFVFDGSEADYLRYQRLAASGSRPSSRDFENPVEVRLADETAWTRKGRMNFVDNQLNARTGTIRGRAIFDNPDFFLTPGTFGRLRLFGGEQDVLLVPDEAIVSDQARKIVLTVGADNKVVAKPVTLGMIAEGLRIVSGGLAAGDRVIISGLANPFVRAGSTVDPQPGEIRTAAK